MPNKNVEKKEYNHPAYVNVPFFVLQDTRLDPFNKLLFATLWSFSVSGKKINTSNGYLATLFKVTEKHINCRLKELEELGFIRRYQVRYKRYIEVLYVPCEDLESQGDCPNLALVPPTGVPSTNIELGTPTGVARVHLQVEGGTPTGVTYNKAYTKEDNKLPSISPKGEKKELFSLTQMLQDNPFEIPETMISDWLDVRKSKRAKMTPTAWTGTNSVLSKLKAAGLNPIECFESMVASGWQGIKLSYFEKEIAALKPKQPLKYVPKEDREAEYERIAARERAAEQAKKAEIDASRGFKDIVKQAKQHVGYKELMKQQEADRAARGMSVQEYHEFVTKNKDPMSENNI